MHTLHASLRTTKNHNLFCIFMASYAKKALGYSIGCKQLGLHVTTRKRASMMKKYDIISALDR